MTLQPGLDKVKSVRSVVEGVPNSMLGDVWFEVVLDVSKLANSSILVL